MTALTRFLTALWAVFLVFAAAGPAAAQGADVSLGIADFDNSQPVEITSESLSVNQQAGNATFEGNVIVGQGEMVLTCDRMVVEYGADEGGRNDIRVIWLYGGVTFVGPSEAAEADSATYTLADETIVLTGNVLVTQGATAISSDRLIYNLQSGSGRMEGRVKTILNPGSN
ncbi:lipopolysaccharide transport periplasmic protein LptA [Psychromarinibacter sp. C21-152]|uniref:Lipopolysaccharide transport periplasmic protein LptA n=1 Tax=Psychromarinibacter sediminicola TaxID=3033385 RepID=A0AAE3NRN5_9RHOB|nr:lipopolysaccharide transport periplasmic protein LptA [Psychromarinibacter sediminicola]MDF0601191.1 lipopolysaccharide transport periplasmic protein LptA [Psychromarinibacter sediminicola]